MTERQPDQASYAPGSEGGVNAGEGPGQPYDPKSIYRAIGESIDYGVWICDPEGRNLYASESFLKLLGITQDQCSNFGWGDALHPDDQEQTIEAWKQCVRTGSKWDREHRFRGVDGKWHHVLARGAPVRNDEGQIIQWAGINLDIGQRKSVEDSLRESEDFNRSIVESSEDCIKVLDLTGHLLSMSSRGQALLGIQDVGSVLGKSWADFWTGSDRENAHSAVATAAAGGRGRMVGLLHNAQGVPKWFDVSISPITDEKGVPVRLLAVSRDVTASRHAELDAMFLAAVNRDLAMLFTAGEVVEMVGAKVAGHLGLSLCNFVTVNERADEATVIHAWHRPDVPSSLGKYRLSDYLSEDFQNAGRAGEAFVVHDTSTDPRTDAAGYASLKMGAFVCMPLVQDGEWRFLLNIHHSTPHRWTQRELLLCRELTNRVWTRLQQVRTEQALLESEARFRTMADAMPQLAWVARADGHIIWYNKGWFDYTGTTREAMEGWGWQSVHHPEELPKVLAHWREAINKGAPFEMTFPLRGADGTYRLFLTRSVPLRNMAGEVVQWVGTNTDVHGLTHAEEALRSSEARKDAILQSALDAIVTIDHEDRLVEFNPAAERIFGYVKADVIGKPMAELLIPARLRAAHKRGLQHYLATGFGPALNHQIEMPAMRADGTEFPAELAIIPIPGFKPPMFTAFVRDVTERKRIEQDLVERVNDLARADRSKDEFLAMLAHELRNPLAPMGTAVELLQLPETSSEEREKAQLILERQIENMSRMIGDLLDVSRITEGKIELRKKPVNLESVLTACTSLVRARCASQGQVLSLTLPKEPIYLEADGTRLEQVFGNLLTNASKYSGVGSHILLAAERSPGVSHEVAVTVSDNGIGIAPDLLPHVFDLFVQSTRSLDRSHGGLGIGLTLVQRLVKLHGGSVVAQSDGLGRGAKFIIRLPILSQAPPPEPETSLPNARETPRRILIVDDNTDSAHSLAALQRRRGHETRTAFTGPDALKAAIDFLPEVVLLDIGLPGMDGFEVARQLRLNPSFQKVMIIAMSGYGSTEDRNTAKSAGFDEYLIKPVDLKVLRDCLQRGNF